MNLDGDGLGVYFIYDDLDLNLMLNYCLISMNIYITFRTSFGPIKPILI